jgi:hypothetical protein
MTVKENHFNSGLGKNCEISVIVYDPIHGYIGTILRRQGVLPTPQTDEVVSAREVAMRFQLSKPKDDVIITYSDGNGVLDNSRNTPFDGNANSVGIDNRGWNIMPKLRCPEPAIGLYDWEPLDSKSLDRLEREVKAKMWTEKKANRNR